MFQPEADLDDPLCVFKAGMEETMQRNLNQLRTDVERMETYVNIAEGDVYRKEEEQFFIRADEMEVGHLLRRQAGDFARLDAAFKELLEERKVRKAAKLTNKRSYKEAKTRYLKIKHQDKVKAEADAVILGSEQHRRRLDQLLQLVDSKHKRQREGLLVSQERRIRSQRAILDLEMRNMSAVLRDEVLFDWESKLAHQVNVDKLMFDQLRDIQSAELTHRKERFDVETKAMAEIADLHIEQLREMGEMEHKQKLDMIIQTHQVEVAREKVSVRKLIGLHHVESRKLKAIHKGQLATLIRQHRSMAKTREHKHKDAMGADLLKQMEQTNEALQNDGGLSPSGGSAQSMQQNASSSAIARNDSFSSIGSGESAVSGMSGVSGVSGMTGVSNAQSEGADTVSSDDTEAEVKAAEEAVQKLMAEDYAKANAAWNAAQEQHKHMYARHKEDRPRLAQQHREQLRQAELGIKTKHEEVDLQHETERRDLRKTHETAMTELVQFMHKDYLVSRSIRLADRKSLAERRVLVAILNTVSDGIISISPNGIVNRFNLAAEKMFGYKAEEIIGQNVKLITPMVHASKHDQYIKEYIKTGGGGGGQAQDQARRKDGSEFPVVVNLSEVREEGSAVLFTGIIRNLEDQLKREEKLQTSRAAKQAELGALIAQLDTERQQTSNLIRQILPSTIADQLMNGEPVRPAKFNDVTVLYTDLVGFTEISSSLGALDVVNFLNDLYSAFDEIISLYDVYKVETIGDAYMCASGVPRPNGNNHIIETAKLALHLMKAIPFIKVPGRPDVTLRMRIGIHTGTVVAGVVGRKMPRYCSFGDTVTIANKMESNSVANKILVSDATYRRLESAGGCRTEPRGDVVISGKGTVKTHFLVGLEGFDPQYPLPNRSAVAPAKAVQQPAPIVVSPPTMDSVSQDVSVGNRPAI
ncbi:hypothetical protein BCR44DRAFT_116244 [Catenaria anguillulae PL171]|uniref:Guanylate cyclase n=1 Tax=Catenaria anguillulae PL171 TaxID=765915 RepID=A0A1Y2HPV2_9FUNG|nr:hypothetical protein BCR44DRAFT_116244 [Catenaria anguillulae PL171]